MALSHITPDYHAELGIAPDASAKAIKDAYHKMARRHHPDHNPDDPEAADRFKAVHEAYAVLRDTPLRAV